MTYEVTYRGDLANPPKVTAVLTHDASGAVSKRPLAVDEAQQDRAYLFKKKWIVRDEFLKQAGPFHLRLEASIQPTLRASQPWVARSDEIPLDIHAALSSIRLVSPAERNPIAYGTPFEIEVSGSDLWDDVVVTAVDMAGAPIPD